MTLYQRIKQSSFDRKCRKKKDLAKVGSAGQSLPADGRLCRHRPGLCRGSGSGVRELLCRGFLYAFAVIAACLWFAYHVHDFLFD